MSGDLLRAQFVRHAGSGGAGAGCVPPGEIWEAATGEQPPSRIAQLLDHASGCPSCALAWRLARDYGQEEIAAIPAVRAAGAGSGGWRIGILAAAAVLTLSVAAYYLQLPDSFRQEAGRYRAPEASGIRTALSEQVALSRSSPVLRWTHEAAEATRWQVRLFDEDLRLLHLSAPQQRPELAIPAGILEKLPPGGRILWQVEALLPGGGRLTSPTFIARVE